MIRQRFRGADPAGRGRAPGVEGRRRCAHRARRRAGRDARHQGPASSRKASRSPSRRASTWCRPFDPGDLVRHQLRAPADGRRRRGRGAGARAAARARRPFRGRWRRASWPRATRSSSTSSARARTRPASRRDVDKHEHGVDRIGAPSNPPGFDAEVIGMATGATKSFTMTYPRTTRSPSSPGGKVDYTVTLKEIKQRVVPDARRRAREGSGRLRVARRAPHPRARRSRARGHRSVGTPGAHRRAEAARRARALPRARRRSSIARSIAACEDFARRLMDQRIDPRQANIDWAAFREGQREPATEAVGSAMALDQVARRENITVTEADLDAELAALRRADRPLGGEHPRPARRKTASWAGSRRGCGARRPSPAASAVKLSSCR